MLNHRKHQLWLIICGQQHWKICRQYPTQDIGCVKPILQKILLGGLLFCFRSSLISDVKNFLSYLSMHVHVHVHVHTIMLMFMSISLSMSLSMTMSVSVFMSMSVSISHLHPLLGTCSWSWTWKWHRNWYRHGHWLIQYPTQCRTLSLSV